MTIYGSNQVILFFMKAIEKNNQEAKKERERARNVKDKAFWFSYAQPIYISQNSHKRTNK